MPKYIWTAKKINNNQIKYQFAQSGNKEKKFTYAEVINFFKNKDEDFLAGLRGSLNEIIHQFPAYFWECVPVSKETINKEFEFVITKSESLNNITQNWTPYKDYINNNHDKHACSFPNLGKDAILVIPIPKTVPGLDFKNISKFTENAPEEQWKEFWQEVGNKLSEELEKSEKPKWLSTSGTGVSYLHVRIDNSPKYYVWKEYKKFDKNTPIPGPTLPTPTPKPVSNTPKEKILQNLDKICIDPIGNLANAELLKNWTAESYSSSEASKKGFLKVKIDTGEEIDLEQFGKFGSEAANRQEIKEAIINSIKQNASDWEIKKEFPDSFNSILVNKKTRIKHWENGIVKSGGNWQEIKESLKKSQTPIQQPNSQENDKFPFLAKLAIGGIIFLILIIFITLVVKRNKKASNT